MLRPRRNRRVPYRPARDVWGPPPRSGFLTPAPRRRRKRASGLAVATAVGAAIVATVWYRVFVAAEDGPLKGLRPVATTIQREAPAPPPASAAPSAGNAAPAEAAGPALEPLAPSQIAIALSADTQLASGTVYAPDYVRLTYPGGDVPAGTGTSADTLVRALRAAGLDLQAGIHRDRVAHPEGYPLGRWASRKPDKDVDHRRLLNVDAFLARHALTVPEKRPATAAIFRPGDLVFWRIGRGDGPDHAGIVTDRLDGEGRPLVVDLHPKDGRIRGDRPVDHWPILRHYRVPDAAAIAAAVGIAPAPR